MPAVSSRQYTSRYEPLAFWLSGLSGWDWRVTHGSGKLYLMSWVLPSLHHPHPRARSRRHGAAAALTTAALTTAALTTAALTTAALLLAGCSSWTSVKAPKFSDKPLPPPEWRAYRIQVDDSLDIKFWGDSELDQSVSVRPDGMISLPYVDDVRAAGLTPVELDAELTRRYAVELKSPELTVIVTGAGGQQIYIGGEVGGTGTLHMTENMTLLQAVHEAGGFLTTSRLKQVMLIRTMPSGERFARTIDMRPVLTGLDPSRDVPLQGNDVIFVPRTKIANVNLWVEQYVNSIIPFQSFVTAAIFQSDLFGSSESSAVGDALDDLPGGDPTDPTGDPTDPTDPTGGDPADDPTDSPGDETPDEAPGGGSDP